MRQFLNIHLLSLIGCYLLAAIGTENVREPSSLYAPSHDVSLPPALHRALFPLFRQRPRLKVDIAMALVAYTGFLICIVYQLGGFILGYPISMDLPALFSSAAVAAVIAAILFKVMLHYKQSTTAGAKLFCGLLLLCCFAMELALFFSVICRLISLF